MKTKLKILMLITAIFLICPVTATAYAQTTETVLPPWLTWDALIIYAAVGAFFGCLHDFNDHQGQIIMPHKINGGTWDMGIISPTVFGAAAGFFALAVSNAPFFNALFPTLANTQYPGILAAVFSGYFYTKTIQVLSSMINTAQSSAKSTT